jgi:glycosyltransferase involved in cell wall biosynthesis
MPRIGVDATSVSPAGKGHARSQRKLAESLAALGRYDVVAFVRNVEAAALLGGLETVVVGEGRALAWEQIGMRRALRGIDVMVTLADRLPLGAEARVVVWLFELPTHRITENRRRGVGAYQRGSDLVTAALWRGSLRRAARVVAGSRATANELGGDIPVVYPAGDDAFGPGPGREGRYVFHLASDDPRDNTESVLAAFARLDTDAELLVGGRLGVRDDELRALGGPNVRFLGRVSDDELVSLYRGALAYVDASLYEGFGYTILEALECGAPVIASERSSIPEVVGEAGLLVDPVDVGAITTALQRVLEEAGLAEDLRRRGFERAAGFTWDRTGEGFGTLIDEVLA